jgi:hypothetical protein
MNEPNQSHYEQNSTTQTPKSPTRRRMDPRFVRLFEGIDEFPYYNGDRVYVKSGEFEGKVGIFVRKEGTTPNARINLGDNGVRIIPLAMLVPVPPQPGPNTLAMPLGGYEGLLDDIFELFERLREMRDRVMRLQVANIQEEQEQEQQEN